MPRFALSDYGMQLEQRLYPDLQSTTPHQQLSMGILQVVGESDMKRFRNPKSHLTPELRSW
jgi:hypothetical protein